MELGETQERGVFVSAITKPNILCLSARKHRV
jgi:hypothetical protein